MTRPVLHTLRLELRPPEERDADFIIRAMSDRRVWEWLSVIPQPYGRGDALHFINEIAPDNSWLISDADGPVGVIGLDTELGYWLIPEAWGQGYITEAGDAVLDWAFSDPERIEVLSGHFEENHRSRHALEKLGFVDAGPKLLGCVSDGRTEIPSRHMVLPRARWQGRRMLALQGDRITLRSLTPQDSAALVALCSAPGVAANLASVPQPFWRADAEALIARSAWRGRPGFRLGVWRADALIGLVGYGGRPLPSVMYAIHPDHAGQGLATEAAQLLLDEVDRRFAPAQIQADHFADNPASGAVLRKLGFRDAGPGQGRSLARDGVQDMHCYTRPALHTKRLMLRPLRPADGDALHGIVSHWDVVRQLGSWPWPSDAAFSHSRSVPFDGTGDVWGIFQNGALIGSIGVNVGSDGAPGIGYMLDPAQHGQGVMTEAARAAISHAFASYDWPELSASTWHDNAASHGLLLKLGFTQTGTSHAPALARGEDTDSRTYRLRRTDWSGASAGDLA